MTSFGIAGDATLMDIWLWHRPCNRQLTELEGNLSNILDAAIDSLRDLV
jgi:hypothetical protein